MTHRLRIACTVAALAAAASSGAAQSPARTVLRVRVRDERGRPVAGAELAVVRELEVVAAGGTTDSSGTRVVAVALRRGAYELVVRRIGYVRAGRFFEAAGDTLSLDVALVPTPRTLETVTVTERESIRRQRMHVDADAIAASRQHLRDGLDIVVRLRPFMVHGLSGMCGPVSHVWVNGKRIIGVVPDAMVLAERGMVLSGPYDLPYAGGENPVVYGTAAAGTGGQQPFPRPMGRNELPIDVATVLASIHPEHVAEVSAHDCNDLSIQKVRTASALFVVLKEGIAYSTRRGSYVSDQNLFERLHVSPPTAPVVSVTSAASVAAPAADSIPPYRRRLLGVFDEATGAVLPGVEVTELRNGSRATTTTTGTVALVYLPDGANTIRLSRTGYHTVELPVTISPTDTVPITALLSRSP